MDCSPPGFSVPGILQARILVWIAIPFSKESSQPRDQAQVSHIAGGFLPAEPQGKPKNTGMGSLSLLQWIFPIQESIQRLLHFRQILYQLSYKGSLHKTTKMKNSGKPSAGMDVEKLDLLYILVGMSNGTATLGNSLTISNKTKHTINMTT